VNTPAGIVVAVRGAVVDVRFDGGRLPALKDESDGVGS